MKKLTIWAVLLTAAHNIHAASSWNWRAYLPSTTSMQEDEPVVRWYQHPDVGPLLRKAEAAIEANDVNALRTTLAQVAALNLPYNDFNSFISRAQSITDTYRSKREGDHYNAIDNLLGNALRTASEREAARQKTLQQQPLWNRWFN